MDQVSVRFYKNLLLLTEIFEPHDEFKKYFKERMFDTPNTQGFIHVSYYLLKIYYKDSIKDKFQWPVICKQTETKFRNDVKECLTSISKEHTDISFPPIFPTHLLSAKGPKFVQIMYKLSMVVLRTYLIREHKMSIPYFPKPGPMQEVTKNFLRKSAQQQQICVKELLKEKDNIEKKAKEFIKNKTEERNKLKESIFKLKEDMKKIVTEAPVNDSAKKRLLNLEDNEIIDAWQRVLVNEYIPSLEKRLKNQEEIYNSLQSVCNILLNLKGEAQILKACNIKKINVDSICQFLPLDIQVSAYNIYRENNLNLINLFALFQYLLTKYHMNNKKNFNKLFECRNELLEINQSMITMNKHLENIIEQIQFFISNDLNKNDECNTTLNITVFNNSATEFDKVLFMPSPPIKVNSFDEGGQNINHNHLKLTPIEGAHKKLFSRHAIKSEKTINHAKEKMPFVQKINFDETQSLNSSCDKSLIQQKFYAPPRIKPTFKFAEKYSRLFATRKPVMNNSIKMSSTEKSILPSMSKEHISFSESYNASQELSQESLLTKPTLKSVTENSKHNEEKSSKSSNKRRSITDLVERYKNLIKRSENSPVNYKKELLDET